MVVVAIIGVLSAIAIPQYQDYVTRSRWADSLTSLAPFKTMVAECMQSNAGDGTQCQTPAQLNGFGLLGANLPTPSFATGPLTIPAAGANAVTIRFTAVAAAGGYDYEAFCSRNVTATTFTCTAGAGDTIPINVLRDTRR
jgi:type IV pilus assembly protein PilA